MKKKTVFRLFAIALPFIFFFVMELILRGIGYGDNYQLFKSVKGANGVEYLTMNENLSKKYFKNTGFQSDSQSDLFLKKKTDSTFRIVVQGASTVVGFPFYRAGSFPRMLQQRLSLTFPEKNIEVINTGITAVNSYTLWDITDKIIDQQPDLVIIYAGHNEYYGALGVGSSASMGSHPTLVRSYLKLKELRFVQLLENGFSKFAESASQNSKTVAETTMMEVMAKEQQIPLDSEVFRAGITQFEGNLNKILQKYQRHDIPVLLSTLVANEKDVKPFISSELDEGEFLGKIGTDSNEVHLIAQNNAKAAYLLGQFYLEKQPDSSKKYLRLAKELDLLRFRAPEQINSTISEFAEKHHLSLVDMNTVFQNLSPDGIIGNELLTEHVHPNVKGYFTMADVFYEKIKTMGLITTWENYIPYKEASRQLPITPIDSIRGQLVVEDLKQSWPFVLNISGAKPMAHHSFNGSSFEMQKAINIHTGKEKWEDVMRQAYHHYNAVKDYKNSLKVAQSLIFEFPEQWKVYEMAHQSCLNMEDDELAGYYANKIENLKPKN